jgi:pulcherriminic acid synthase
MSPIEAEDPWQRYATCRRTDPVRRRGDAAVFELYRHADIKHVLTDDAFTVSYPFRISKQILGETLLDIDGRKHAELRRAAAYFFESENIARLETSVFEPLARQILDALPVGTPIDFVRDCATRFPIGVMSRLIGIREAEVAPLYRKVDYLVQHLDGSKGDFETASRLREELRQQLAREILPRGEGALAQYVNGLDAGIGDAERIGLLLLILFAGIETSVSTLANTVSCLLRHPRHLDAMAHTEGFAANALQEAIRWEPAQHETVRFAATDCVVGGVPLEKGAALVLYLASANRDEAVYRDAHVFDPLRAEKHNLSFGLGRHYCLGKKFALAALEGFLFRFFQRFDIEEGSVELAPVTGGMFRRPDSLRFTLSPAHPQRHTQEHIHAEH